MTTTPDAPPAVRPEALLCDRDGTLVVDVPYNDDPAKVELLPGVAAALAQARDAGLRVGVVTNQSGVAKHVITPERLDLVHERLVALVGPLDALVWCPHDDGDGCACRKPEPGMVLTAAARLGVAPAACVVVGDIAADVTAARRAGATGILVGPESADAPPGTITRPDLPSAVDLVLAWRASRRTSG